MSIRCSRLKANEHNGDLSFFNQSPTQWRETPHRPIDYAPKEETIFLSGGLTLLQDELIEAALNGMGIRFITLPNPDFASFQTGKSFGNRGQCNPTYFTVGNLIKYLQHLRDEKGLSTEEIIQKYVYITAGGCGPCRFGMYITEYKKALRDAGFEGFRITAFDHEKGIFQGEKIKEKLLEYTPRFFITLIKAVIIGDIINLLGYRMRPYEKEKGSTDAALKICKKIVAQAFLSRTSLTRALWRCRSHLLDVQLDRLQPKPKVMVIGEFWAAMTEGDGNYNLYRFLEAEGAECIPQPIINRLMLSIWEAEELLTQTQSLPSKRRQRVDLFSLRQKILIGAGKAAIRLHLFLYAKAIGLHNYTLPDIKKLATLAKPYYTLECSGGEGHMEVAHLIEAIEDNLAHLVISVKPFGCMPSSAVSDGIQSLVIAHYPQANFLSIETSGEGAANFYSRVQMALFKAKQSAKEEFASLNRPTKIPSKVHSYLYQPRNEATGTAAALIRSIH